MARGCAYLGLQVKAINCISPCLCPVLIGFNPLPTVLFSQASDMQNDDLLRYWAATERQLPVGHEIRRVNN
jgi:hypothetical protein